MHLVQLDLARGDLESNGLIQMIIKWKGKSKGISNGVCVWLLFGLVCLFVSLYQFAYCVDGTGLEK